MGDALCGPSNALQHFQKHASVDHTLQKDRLTLRQGPSEGFRSAPGLSAGALDPEFDAFQAGHSSESIQPIIQRNFTGLPSSVANATFQPVPVSPNWATDFQRLTLTSPPLNNPFPTHGSTRQVTPSGNQPSWYHDFLKSSSLPAAMQSPSALNMAPFGRVIGHTPTFRPANSLALEYNGQQKGKEPVSSPGNDNAAFERAFEAAQADFLESSGSLVEATRTHEGKIADGRIPEEANPLMRLTWEKQPVAYLVVKIWNAFGLSTDAAPFRHDTAQNASAFLRELEHLEETGRLQEEGEVFRTQKILTRILQLDEVPLDSQYQFAARARNLLEKIEGRSQLIIHNSIQHDQLADPDQLQDAETVHDVKHLDPKDRTQIEKEGPVNDDEELARTAGHLLESVSDNTSKKFQESNFLALMRKLRDREVRVEGDKMVGTPIAPTPAGNGQIPTIEQDEDLGRLPPSNEGYNVEPFA